MGILKKAIQALILLSLVGCSAQTLLKMAVKKDPSIVQRDTVIQEVPVVVPEVKTDTVFESEEGDTVVIEKERLKIKYVNLPGDSVFIEGECKTDTVMVKVEVPVEKYVIRTSYKDWFKEFFKANDLVFYVLHIGLVLLTVYLIIRRIIG